MKKSEFDSQLSKLLLKMACKIFSLPHHSNSNFVFQDFLMFAPGITVNGVPDFSSPFTAILAYSSQPDTGGTASDFGLELG